MVDPAHPMTRVRRPAPQPSLRELALEEIRLAITTGQLDEGRTYSAAGLAKELGMSLSPVREAMMSLVSEETIEAVPNRGFRLRPISAEDLDEIMAVRLALATAAVAHLCTRVAAPPSGRGDDVAVTAQVAELIRLAAAGVSAVESGAPAEFLRLDREFHRSLLEYGLGRRAAEISLRLRDQSRRVDGGRPIFIADAQTAQDLVEISDLVAAGDAGGAQQAVTRNLRCYESVIASPLGTTPAV